MQGSPGNKFSWIPQPSAENLNSKGVFFSTIPEISQTLSLFESVIDQQSPHQLLKVPFTSGVVNEFVTAFISTWKVTNAESANVWENECDEKANTNKL